MDRRFKMVSRTTQFAVMCLWALNAAGAVVTNPTLHAVTLGAEAEDYRWSRGEPVLEGGYDAGRTSYTLTGNGHGIYWCQDGAGFAFVDGPSTCGSFTFTARVKGMVLPDGGFSQVGIAVKGRLGTAEPSLSLRWDSYWSSKGSGLTWFNRIVKMVDMPSIDAAPSEQSCHGIGQGCLGGGLENTIPGYPERTDLWLRVKRVVDVSGSRYYLYARPSSSAEWQEIPSIAGAHNACGSSMPLVFAPNMKLPNFMIPEDEHGRVYVGVFVGNGTYGKEKVTATFDNITLETDEPAMQPVPFANSFSPDAVWWPTFLGPNGDYTTSDDKWELVPDLRDAVKVWKSEEAVPPGKNSKEVPCRSGGGSSVVAADGKVYLYHFLPAEPTRDVVLCMSAIDGKTVWRKVLDPSTYICGKSTMSNQTVCVFGGRVYACGSSGRLYCLDGKNGDLIWTNPAAGSAQTSGLIIADGVLVYNTGGGRNSERSTTVHGFDIATGKEMWKCVDCSGGGATPSLWKHKGKEYIIVANRDGVVRCIAPSGGEVLWQKGGFSPIQHTVRVSEDYAVVNGMGDGADGEVAGIRVTPQGATELWRLPRTNGSHTSAIIYKGYLYAYTENRLLKESLLVIEMATGKIVGKQLQGATSWGGSIVATTTSSSGGYQLAVNNRIIINQQEGHTPMQMVMFQAVPDFRLSSLGIWYPPNRQTCTYSENCVGMAFPYVDGRVFVRGRDAIYCYDLRKRPSCDGTSAVSGPFGSARPQSKNMSGHRGFARGYIAYDIRGRTVYDARSSRRSGAQGILIMGTRAGAPLRITDGHFDSIDLLESK